MIKQLCQFRLDLSLTLSLHVENVNAIILHICDKVSFQCDYL